MGEGGVEGGVVGHVGVVVDPFVVGGDFGLVPEDALVGAYAGSQFEFGVEGSSEPVDRVAGAVLGAGAWEVVLPLHFDHPSVFRVFDGSRGAFEVEGYVGGLEELLLAVWVDTAGARTAVAEEDGVEDAWVAVDADGYVFGGLTV